MSFKIDYYNFKKSTSFCLFTIYKQFLWDKKKNVSSVFWISRSFQRDTLLMLSKVQDVKRFANKYWEQILSRIKIAFDTHRLHNYTCECDICESSE